MYDILIQNNSSKEIFLLSGMTPYDETEYYINFQGIDMPEGVKSGEYTYAVILNDREDVDYTFNSVLLQTKVYVEETDESFTLEQLNPLTGLLKIDLGEEQPTPIYSSGDTTNNNTVYYYEG